MIIFNTWQSIFISFSQISIIIVRLQHSCYFDIWVTFWEFQYDTGFLLSNKTLSYRYYWYQIWLCMIIFSTVQSIFISFSQISITIVRLQTSSFILISELLSVCNYIIRSFCRFIATFFLLTEVLWIYLSWFRDSSCLFYARLYSNVTSLSSNSRILREVND